MWVSKDRWECLVVRLSDAQERIRSLERTLGVLVAANKALVNLTKPKLVQDVVGEGPVQELTPIPHVPGPEAGLGPWVIPWSGDKPREEL